jgi:RNA polymerase sigma-70 factor (ECF subfamily)
MGDCTLQALTEEPASGKPEPTGDLVRWVEAMRGGDERALEELYDATVGKLYALASAILRNNEDAEEVVCATYAYAWANAGRFDTERAEVLGWLLMLCRSRALDRLRHCRRQAEVVDIAGLDLAAENAQPEDMIGLLQQTSRVRRAMSMLTPERRRLVSLAFLQGLSHQEIVDVTRLPLGTVKSHMRRALTQLREALQE